MEYKQIIQSYKLNNCASPTERIRAVRDLFILLKNEGLKKTDLNDELLNDIEKIVSDSSLSKQKQILLTQNLINFFLMLVHSLENGKIEEEEDVVEETYNDSISQMKPEDFKDKEYDREFMEMIGATADPDKGSPNE